MGREGEFRSPLIREALPEYAEHPEYSSRAGGSPFEGVEPPNVHPMIFAVCINSSTAMAESSGVSLNSATREFAKAGMIGGIACGRMMSR